MLSIENPGSEWTLGNCLVVINYKHTVSIRAEGVQLCSFVFKTEFEFVITTKNIFFKVVCIHYEIVRRTINWFYIKQCVFVSGNCSKVDHRNIFSALWNQRKSQSDITITSGDNGVIIWNKGVLAGPDPRGNGIGATLIP